MAITEYFVTLPVYGGFCVVWASKTFDLYLRDCIAFCGRSSQFTKISSEL